MYGSTRGSTLPFGPKQESSMTPHLWELLEPVWIFSLNTLRRDGFSFIKWFTQQSIKKLYLDHRILRILESFKINTAYDKQDNRGERMHHNITKGCFICLAGTFQGQLLPGRYEGERKNASRTQNHIQNHGRPFPNAGWLIILQVNDQLDVPTLHPEKWRFRYSLCWC